MVITLKRNPNKIYIEFFIGANKDCAMHVKGYIHIDVAKKLQNNTYTTLDTESFGIHTTPYTFEYPDGVITHPDPDFFVKIFPSQLNGLKIEACP